MKGDVYAVNSFEAETGKTVFGGLPMADYPFAITERSKIGLVA
jgi:hypothetical protein